MPDISMCRNTECPMKTKCYRSEASGTKMSFRQSMTMFAPDENGKCEYFWPIEKRLSEEEESEW